MTERADLCAKISRALSDRALVWFGIRGEDAASYLGIPQFAESFSITAPLRAGSLRSSIALEDITGSRVDLDAYDIDLDSGPHVSDMRGRLLAALRRPSAVVTYRPSHFLSAIHLASLASAEYLGMFKDCQVAFEHKPWVETSLARIGIRTLPWTYVADEHRNVIKHELERGPRILRPSRTSGGEGITLVESPEDLDRLWPERSDHLVAVAPFLAEAIPLNVGGCVFDADTVTVHPASFQLIGISSCTTRRFGYCGNDFAAVKQLQSKTVAQVATMTVQVGRWLASRGYVGAYGVDYLIDGDAVLFTEVNARLQGSSAPSSALAGAINLPDILLEHLAAAIGLRPTRVRTLDDWLSELPAGAHVVVHNIEPQPVVATSSPWMSARPAVRADLLPRTRLSIEPGGVFGRLAFDRQITSTGFDLTDGATAAIAQLRPAIGVELPCQA